MQADCASYLKEKARDILRLHYKYSPYVDRGPCLPGLRCMAAARRLLNFLLHITPKIKKKTYHDDFKDGVEFNFERVCFRNVEGWSCFEAYAMQADCASDLKEKA
ncbi:hypothetical protein MTR_6g462620 [Medicago truncatula]|uniref:Uncharacterized protein n=1 Tax=Medicago truncatula TaxID=3880 RepID=A0A072UAN5_MEDTR|nr:hypothetical protein MTR_6g462620 [Medicago truncatula]